VVLTLPIALFFALPEGLGRRAGPGKRRLGLRLVGPDGAPLGLRRSLLRSLIKFLPWELAHTAVWRLPQRPDDPLLMALALIGMALTGVYIATLFLGDGRTPYDRLSGSRVVAA
jgi:uncharacterized RDD family membrane protein YckC